MESTTVKPELSVPEQKTATLSFCDDNPKAFSAWAEQLPLANVGEASRQLYHAVIELNQIFIPALHRLTLLELLRPKIQFVCSQLSRHYLGLALTLPERQRKIANLSQALQLHLAYGYKLCLLELIDHGGMNKHRKSLALSCHRAVTELGATILRAHQLYCPSPTRSWLECHRIFRFADTHGMTGLLVADPMLQTREGSTIADAYKRVLLLGSARANQLRQAELMQIYDVFESWTDLVGCHSNLSDSLFVVAMEQDKPPIYRSLMQGAPDKDCFGLDTTRLSQRIADNLKARRENEKPGPEARLPLPAGFSDTLLTHLSQALGILTKRNFNRIVSQGALHVCVGLSAAHYFVAGGKSFTQFIAGNENQGRDESTSPENNVFLRSPRNHGDVWAGVPDMEPTNDRLGSSQGPITFPGKHDSAPDSGAKNLPGSYKTVLLDTSPGGYCVSWETDVPSALQAGEILGVREQLSHPWSLAVVRWIRQVRFQAIQVGIELIAPSAAPCAVRLIPKMGNSSEYLRGLLLPELSAVNQAATLITPRLQFQTGSRISLLHDGREDEGHLSRQVSATGSISQFELQLHKQTVRPDHNEPCTAPSTANEDEFDSLWPSL
ncbi:MAG: GTPase [Oleiphilaceae bacterium]|nr:GTPase [Oleiphilaceae bacterium]